MRLRVDWRFRFTVADMDPDRDVRMSTWREYRFSGDGRLKVGLDAVRLEVDRTRLERNLLPGIGNPSSTIFLARLTDRAERGWWIEVRFGSSRAVPAVSSKPDPGELADQRNALALQALGWPWKPDTELGAWRTELRPVSDFIPFNAQAWESSGDPRMRFKRIAGPDGSLVILRYCRQGLEGFGYVHCMAKLELAAGGTFRRMECLLSRRPGHGLLGSYGTFRIGIVSAEAAGPSSAWTRFPLQPDAIRRAFALPRH